MSQWDVRALETNFEGWRAERMAHTSVSDAFERYVVEAVFKDADFSDDEISSGLIGGGNDGGVDGIYFTLDGRLMLEDTEVPPKPSKAALWLVQAKNTAGFQETPLLRIKSLLEDVLDFDRPVDDMTHYTETLRDFILGFREKLSSVLDKVNDTSINIVYATKSDHHPSVGVLHRKAEIEAVVKMHLSAATINCDFWGAKLLLDTTRSQPERTYSLDVVSYFPVGGSFIGISRLDSYAAFITDEKGRLRQSFLEPNVRDYNGYGNKVNEDIRSTLYAGDKEEFWWLNNGITILAEDCNFAMGKLNIKLPEIVNGLQTSTEIFNYFEWQNLIHSAPIEDKRLVLIRVILPPSDAVRSRIVKATNSQSPVTPLSLHANDDIHFDIEELFKLRNLYYDRRKGEYRRKRMPIAQIISMTDVAQVVIATALRAPDDARARPRKRLDSESGYADVFDVNVSRTMFLNCVRIDRSVKRYLETRPDISRDEKTDIRFYMDTWLACSLTRKDEPTKADIASIPLTQMPMAEESMLLDACENVRSVYRARGSNSKAAKSAAMRDAVLSAIKARSQKNEQRN